LITLVFTAANVYLGLKVGLTFASSIPAAVISMAVLRAFKTSTIYENNIVQTVASAAGTLSSIIFVLPGLVMIGWWTGFPYWESFGVCAVGGVLGVMYSVPLRRALVTNSDLPYPEGVAAAEVLRVGAGSRGADSVQQSPSAQAVAENKAGLVALLVGSITSAAFAAIIGARVFAAEAAKYFNVGSGATGFGLSLSLALIGAGQLIGLAVGLAIFTGLIISWGIATPIISALQPLPGIAADVATATWQHKVRFIGAGTIGIAAIWTLISLARPVWGGVRSALAVTRPLNIEDQTELPITDRDIPIRQVGLISVLCLVPLAALLAAFLSPTQLSSLMVPLVFGAVLYVMVAGFLVAAACGYMAGLIGSSNSPVSGLAILTVIGASLLLVLLAKTTNASIAQALVAYSLLVTAVVLCVATISNDNLQDLKTGQLVGATPSKQQWALIVGVIMGALVIPPILDLLSHAYGFAGAPNVRVTPGSQALPAPQATLISALAVGVIKGHIDWGLIGIGVLVGVVVIALDETLRRRIPGFKLPPLAVGLGIYLPAATTAPAVLGAVIGWWYNRWVQNRPAADVAKRLAVLVASGLIVGESVFGVLLAALIVASGKATPLAVVGDAFQPYANVIGPVAFAMVLIAIYSWTARLSQKATAE
ncbi:MAG: oligopeptide transporter, OPT family, partial [Candidatus Eremiobacteraeota bacterium]|nr:oligopeptide transporter, OPT family [Candidatus Eremiobacteraeota bacterium]